MPHNRNYNSRAIILAIIFLLNATSFSSGNNMTKSPNVSGQFYSSDSQRLSQDIDTFFSQASIKPYDKEIRFPVVIVPHAGYVYSGGVAAYGFKALSRKNYKTIVILAGSHYVNFDGMSVWGKGSFKTPLGEVGVDEDFSRKLIASHDRFYFEPRAFDREHSLEVEIPFAQKTFKDFKIVPVVMGQPSFSVIEDFAQSLSNIIGDRDDVLIVVSTDLSHYHSDEKARNFDRQAIEAVKNFEAEKILKECRLRIMEMCGHVPVVAAILYAKEKGAATADVLRYQNSGDVSGDKSQVVGYTSILIYRDTKDSSLSDSKSNQSQNNDDFLNMNQKRQLINIAKKTIHEYVLNEKVLDIQEKDSRLKEIQGAFVTIHKHGQLRGCIGNIIGRQPLFLTVRDMAISAASQDPRFPPVRKEELKDLDIEVSVLSKPRVVKNADEIELGVHGVIVSRGIFNQGVFLPQVADSTGWSKEEFLSQLCSQKARLPRDAWKDPKTKLEIFTAEVFSEKDVE